MASSSSYYINASTFATATAVYTDAGLSTKAADGFYSDGTNYRQQINGTLGALTACPDCNTSSTLNNFITGGNVGTIHITNQSVTSWSIIVTSTPFTIQPSPYTQSGVIWDGTSYSPAASLGATGSSPDSIVQLVLSGTQSLSSVFCNLQIKDSSNVYTGTVSRNGDGNIVVSFNIGSTKGRTLEWNGGEINLQ